MTDWKRARLTVSPDTRGVFMSGVLPTITMRPSAPTGNLRVGLWVANDRLAGWWIPFLPPTIPFTIRQGKASAVVNGARQDLPRQLYDWGGQRWPSRDTLMPYGSFTITLDQEPDKAVPVLVDLSVESVESV